MCIDLTAAALDKRLHTHTLLQLWNRICVPFVQALKLQHGSAHWLEAETRLTAAGLYKRLHSAHAHTAPVLKQNMCAIYASLKASTLVSILVVGQWPMVSTLVGSTDQTNDCSCDKRLHTHTLLHFYGWILWNGICVPYMQALELQHWSAHWF